MKNLVAVFALSIACLFGSSAISFAGGGSYGDRHDRDGRGSRSSANASADVDVNVQSKNANNNNNNLSVQTGPVTVNGGSNATTVNPVVNANPTVTTGANVSNITVEAPKIAAQAPGIPESAGTTPHIFWGNPTLPANVLGINMTLEYLKACKPRYKAGVNLEDIVKKGISGLTQVTFTPHANYAEQKNTDPVKEVSIAMPPDASYRDRYVCLGVMKVEAFMKGASASQLDTLYNDAGAFAVEKIKGGYDEVYLITVPNVIAVNLGVSNKGGGFGVAPALSDLAGDTFRGLGAALSGNKGDTFPAAQLGTTFLVLAKPKQGEAGTEVNLGSLLTLPTHKPMQ